MVAVWTLLALLAALLLLLAIPVELSFSLQRHGNQKKSSGTLGWLFGKLQMPLGKPGPKLRTKHKSKARKRRHAGRRRIMPLLQTDGFGQRLRKLVRDLLRCIHIRELNLDLRFGLDDPADTGRLWSVVGPLAAISTIPHSAHIRVEPEFTSEAFEFIGQGRLQFIPAQLLLTILVFVFSPVTLRALYASVKR